jgi:hypothetical protein
VALPGPAAKAKALAELLREVLARGMAEVLDKM